MSGRTVITTSSQRKRDKGTQAVGTGGGNSNNNNNDDNQDDGGGERDVEMTDESSQIQNSIAMVLQQQTEALQQLFSANMQQMNQQAEYQKEQIQIQRDQLKQTIEAQTINLARQTAGPAPVFAGGKPGLEVHRWGTQMEAWCSTAGVTLDEKKLEIVNTCLKEDAHTWYTQKKVEWNNAGTATWSVFITAIKEYYSPKQIELYAREEIDTLVSTKHENVADYNRKYAEFDAIAKRADDIDRIRLYEKGLPQKMVERLAAVKSKTLAGVMEQALSIYLAVQAAGPQAKPSGVHHMEGSSDTSSCQSSSTGANDKQGAGGDALLAFMKVQNEYLKKLVNNNRWRGGRGGTNTGRGGGGRDGQRQGGGYRGGYNNSTSSTNTRSNSAEGRKPWVQGVSDVGIRERLTKGLCVQCGQAGHMKRECANSIVPIN